MSFTIGIDVGGTFTDIVVDGLRWPDDHRQGDNNSGGSVGRRAGRHRFGGAATWPDAGGVVARNVPHRARHDGRHQRVAGGQDRAGRIADHRRPSRRHRNARGSEAGTLQPAHGAAGAAGAARNCGCRFGNGCGRMDPWRSRWTRHRSIRPSRVWPRKMCERSRSAFCMHGAIRSTNCRPRPRFVRDCRMPM